MTSGALPALTFSNIPGGGTLAQKKQSQTLQTSVLGVSWGLGTFQTMHHTLGIQEPCPIPRSPASPKRPAAQVLTRSDSQCLGKPPAAAPWEDYGAPFRPTVTSGALLSKGGGEGRSDTLVHAVRSPARAVRVCATDIVDSEGSWRPPESTRSLSREPERGARGRYFGGCLLTQQLPGP